MIFKILFYIKFQFQTVTKVERGKIIGFKNLPDWVWFRHISLLKIVEIFLLKILDSFNVRKSGWPDLSVIVLGLIPGQLKSQRWYQRIFFGELLYSGIVLSIPRSLIALGEINIYCLFSIKFSILTFFLIYLVFPGLWQKYISYLYNY